MSASPVDRLFSRRPEQLDAGIYLAGTLFQRLSLFLALPALLRSLPAAAYGTFGLLQSSINLLPAILTLNLPAAVTRLYFDGATAADRQAIARKLTILSALVGLLASLAILLTAYACRSRLGSLLGLTDRSALVATGFVMLGALGSAHLQIAWGIWRAENRALHTAVANTTSGVLFLVAVGILASRRALDAVSAVAAYASATAIMGFAANALAVAHRPGPGRVSFAALGRDALRYGFPVLPYLLALWGLGAGGRWIARATLSLEDTGRFTLASQLTIMIGLVGRSAYDAWSPRSFEMFAAGRTSKARAYLRRRGRQTLAGVACLSAATAAALTIFLPRFAPSYAGVTTVFPLMALAPVFDVAYMTHHFELMGIKVTRPIAKYTSVTVGLFMILGIGGAKLAGLWGLAVAYVTAYVCQWALARRAVQQIRQRLGDAEAPSTDGLEPTEGAAFP